MVVKKKSLVVFHNREVIAHDTHNKAIDEYAERYGIDKDEAYTKGHILSMLVLLEHDLAEVILHFGDAKICKEILEEIGINMRGG